MKTLYFCFWNGKRQPIANDYHSVCSYIAGIVGAYGWQDNVWDVRSNVCEHYDIQIAYTSGVPNVTLSTKQHGEVNPAASW